MACIRTTLCSSLATVGLLSLLASAASAAANFQAYLKGTYVFINFDDLYGTGNNLGEADQAILTFDGEGNYSGTDTNNSDGTITSSSMNSGTYTAAADGTFTFIGGDASPYSGTLSGDGNTFVLTPLAAGHQAQIAVGIKKGGVAYLNTASGIDSLVSNTTGANNTAFGANALYSNTVGKGNAAQGVNALYANTTGIRNLGIGSNALYENTSGGYNIALGFDAGYYVTTGSNNIEIGASGTATDDNTIQIGAQGTQTLTKIAGIYGTPVTGAAVFVTASGQLGTQASSERFKAGISTMPEVSDRLAQLRPVTFHYRNDPKASLQFGLIAEEVDRVYPELVIRDDSGQIQGVHYEELAPMLLSEVQQQQIESVRQRAQLQQQSKLLQQQDAVLQDVREQLVNLKKANESMQAAMTKMMAMDGRVAMQ